MPSVHIYECCPEPGADPVASAPGLAKRLREALGDTPQALRDLSVSLNNVGQIEGDLGDLEAVRTAWRESLEVLQHLRESSPRPEQFETEAARLEALLKALQPDEVSAGS